MEIFSGDIYSHFISTFTSGILKAFDVFINHRGPDVKHTLAFQLYTSLKNMGLRPFLDLEELQLGDTFPSTIETAIRSAPVHVAIFSKGYAESAWCLAELSLMLKTNGKIIPVFYGVEPWELRHIEKGVYAEAFAKYEGKRRYLDKLKGWKKCLNEVSYISGLIISSEASYKDLQKILSAVVEEMRYIRPLDVATHPVGLDEIVADFERRCGENTEENVKIVGIFAMGGSGKTTLAKEWFNLKRWDFERSSFVFDVREASANSELPALQSKLLGDLFGEHDSKCQSLSEGTAYLKYRMGQGSRSRFLIVLDDVDHLDHLNALLFRDELNSGSLVIVTTRDERLLIQAGISLCYKMKEMDRLHGRELFCWHAFHNPCAPKEYEHYVESFVQLCGGLPLSLRVMGGYVYGADKTYWESALNKFRNTLPGDVTHKLKVSYDALDREQKEIFMDIASFFIGKSKSMGVRIWEGSGWRGAEHTVQTLKDKCLVDLGWNYGTRFEYDDKLIFRMHDHLRDLGRDMAREMAQNHMSPLRLWRPRDLKSQQSKGFKDILSGTNGRNFRCFNSILDSSLGCQITFFLGNLEDCDELSTTLLWIELEMNGLEHTNIPSWIPLKDLQCLRIVGGRLQRLCPSDVQAPFQLKELLLHMTSLAEFSNELGLLVDLENLVLTGRWDESKFMKSIGMIIEGRSFTESIRKLSNLRRLVLRDFTLTGEVDLSTSGDPTSSKSSTGRCMHKLESIEIREVKLASKVSISGEYCPSLESLHIESMENLNEVDLRLQTSLNCVKLRSCKELKTVSGNFGPGKLAVLDISDCPELEMLPSLSRLNTLERIIVGGCGKLHNITGIEELQGLKYLHLSASNEDIGNCIHRLQKLPSEATTVIGRAVDEAESILKANVFSDMIGGSAVTEIHINKDGNPEVSVNMADSLDTIIICALVESAPNMGKIQILLPSDRIDSYIGEGKWIVTVVLSGEKEVDYGRRCIARSDLIMSGAQIKGVCIVTMNKGEENKPLHVVKKINGELHQGKGLAL